MNKIYIEFTRPDKWFQPLSWVIRKFQKTPYSHVRLHWKSKGSGEDLIYEASGSAVKVIGAYAQQNYPVKVITRIEVSITNEEYRKLIKMFRYSSVKYSKLQMIGMVFPILLGIRNPFRNDRFGFICSELIWVFCKEVKNIELDFDRDSTGPKEIYQALLKMLDNPDIKLLDD